MWDFLLNSSMIENNSQRIIGRNFLGKYDKQFTRWYQVNNGQTEAVSK